MRSFKIDKVCEEIKREIANILAMIRDPRINSKILTIVNVSLTKDMSYSKIRISSIDGLESAINAVEGLNHAKGLIKKEIGNRLKIRRIPELQFIADNTVEDAINMFKKIEKNNTQKILGE